MQPGEVVVVTFSPRSSSKARGLMQGWDQEPAGTGTEAAAPGILHAKGCLEDSRELTSSWGQGEGRPGRQLRVRWGGKRGHCLKSERGTGAIGCCCRPALAAKPGLH